MLKPIPDAHLSYKQREVVLDMRPGVPYRLGQGELRAVTLRTMESLVRRGLVLRWQSYGGRIRYRLTVKGEVMHQQMRGQNVQ